MRGVTCEVRHNLVHHTGYTGIAITGVAGAACSPLVVSNICHRNMGGGIGSMNGSTAVIRGNTCFENFYAGIGHENASPLVESNRCFGNIRAGIGISEGASPTVRFNECRDNRRAGIGIRMNAGSNFTLRADFAQVVDPGGNQARIDALVDAGAEAATDLVLAELKKLTARPIRAIITTSPDLDRIGGNDKLAKIVPNETVTGLDSLRLWLERKRELAPLWPAFLLLALILFGVEAVIANVMARSKAWR